MTPAPAGGVSTGANGRPIDDTMAETGPGIADDAVLDGELRPGDLDAGADATVRALKASGWAGEAPAAEDAEGEAQAHPS